MMNIFSVGSAVVGLTDWLLESNNSKPAPLELKLPAPPQCPKGQTVTYKAWIDQAYGAGTVEIKIPNQITATCVTDPKASADALKKVESGKK